MAAEAQPGRDTSVNAALQPPAALSAGMQDVSAEAALIQSVGQIGDIGELAIDDSPLARIPVEIDVSIPIRNFRVRDLIAIGVGQAITTEWLEGEDMPLGARGAQLAWAELEVIERKLAVRITRLI